MGEARPAAVVCDDRPAVLASTTELLHATGYELAASTLDLASLTEAVRTHSARVAIVALPLVGMTGMAAVTALREAAPWCEVVVLEAPGTLAVAALEAGARAALPDDDLRALRAVLLEMIARPRLIVLPEPRPQADAAAEEGSDTGSVSTNPSS